MKKRDIKRWAWEHAANIVSADASAGYFDEPDGADRQLCIEALQEVAAEIRRKHKKPTPPKP